MEMWITVLDYSGSSIRIYHTTDIPTDTEAWLYEHDPYYKDSQCYYMCSAEKPNVEYKEG